MLTSLELQALIKTQYIIFVKLGCPFSKASMELLDTLKETNVIDSYRVLMLFDDCDEPQLTQICALYGVVPQRYATKVSLPQLFMKGEYVGGCDKFYASRWNLGEDDCGITDLYDAQGIQTRCNAPQKMNPTIIL